MKINKDSAILLGNGINYNNSVDYSWKKILLEIANEKKDINCLKDSGTISYPEFFDAIIFNKSKQKKLDIKKCISEVKKQICDKIINWNETDRHVKIVNYAKDNDIPILTTNYDITLEKALFKGNNRVKKKKKIYLPSGEYYHYRYPWHQYYSDKKIDVFLNSFAIWHIHGFIYYPQSIMIGADDYASIINHAKDHINNKKNGLYASLRNNTAWKGNNSWLNIFFHKNLYIIGLSLECQETGLRWLLMQREKYFRDDERRRKKTNYIYSNSSDLSSGKQFFFKSLGIDTEQYPSYDYIYTFEK